jgi:hypothetical protein
MKSVIDEFIIELIETGSSAVRSEIHKSFIALGIRKNYLTGRSQLFFPFSRIRKMMMIIIQIAVIIKSYVFMICIQNFIEVTIKSAIVKFFRQNGSLLLQ